MRWLFCLLFLCFSGFAEAGSYFYGGQSKTSFTVGENGHHHVEMVVTLQEKPTQLSAPNHLYVILPFARGVSLTTQFTETMLGLSTTWGTQSSLVPLVASTEFPYGNGVRNSVGVVPKLSIGTRVKMTVDKWDGEINVYSAWYVAAVNGTWTPFVTRLQYVGPYYHFPGEVRRLKVPDAEHPTVTIQPWVTGGGIHPAQVELYRKQGNCRAPVLVLFSGVSIFPEDINTVLYSDVCLHTMGTFDAFTVSTD